MKIIFMGTSDFAVATLKAISKYHDIVAVVTQPDKPVGRRGALVFSPIKQFAIDNNLHVLQYNKVSREGIEDLRKLNANIIITASYGQILSKEILELTPYGVYNVHGSLLPKYRGASPIQNAILNGEKVTGISILKSGIGIDDGPVMLKKELEIEDGETAEQLFVRLADLGAKCIIKALKLIETGKSVLVAQDESLATVTKMIQKSQAEIIFDMPCHKIINMVRAFIPWPVAYTFVNGAILQIYKARKLDDAEILAYDLGEFQKYQNGEVVCCNPKIGLIVKAMDGFLILLEVKPENSKLMNAKDYLNGKRIFPNMILGK